MTPHIDAITETLATENARLKKDAERYRWLRRNVSYGSDEWNLFFTIDDISWSPFYRDGDTHVGVGVALDRAIDAEMSKP